MKNIFEHQLSDGALPFLPSDEDQKKWVKPAWVIHNAAMVNYYPTILSLIKRGVSLPSPDALEAFALHAAEGPCEVDPQAFLADISDNDKCVTNLDRALAYYWAVLDLLRQGRELPDLNGLMAYDRLTDAIQDAAQEPTRQVEFDLNGLMAYWQVELPGKNLEPLLKHLRFMAVKVADLVYAASLKPGLEESGSEEITTHGVRFALSEQLGELMEHCNRSVSLCMEAADEPSTRQLDDRD